MIQTRIMLPLICIGFVGVLLLVLMQMAPALTSAFIPARCHTSGSFPDPTCTPGALNSDVTQSNIHQTICIPGWTATVRPPVSYTNPLKVQSIKDYGYTDTDPNHYEFDHFIPLTLGGHPTDTKNLWAEPGASPNQKDRVEVALNRAVCEGRLQLTDAQERIRRDWTTALKGIE